MSRPIVLIIVLLLLAGALFYLSTVPKERATHQVEISVPPTAAAGGNAR